MRRTVSSAKRQPQPESPAVEDPSRHVAFAPTAELPGGDLGLAEGVVAVTAHDVIDIVDDRRSAPRRHIRKAKRNSTCSNHDPPIVQAPVRWKPVLGEVALELVAQGEVVPVHRTSFGPTLRTPLYLWAPFAYVVARDGRRA
jgi:hypothetical protein